jgi:fibro-slime domain-containing protein
MDSWGLKKHVWVLAGLGLLGGQVAADELVLTGTLRDIKRGDWSSGHPDFQTAGAMNRFGHVKNLVTMYLGGDDKPVFNPARPQKDTIRSAASLAQWYTDTPGVNISAPLALTLSNGSSEPGGVYTYSNSAFFPIDGQLFGNQGLTHNFHFTFELHYAFTFAEGQKFIFTGDDDVWVYINGIRVIDLGGVHSAVSGKVILFDGKAFVEKNHFDTGGIVKDVSTAMASQMAALWSAKGLPGPCPISASANKYIDLGLQPGQTCKFDFFFAERHTTQSNFRIDTSIRLRDPAEIFALYD